MNANEIWERFEDVLRLKAPYDHAALRPPATPKQISEAEAAMGVDLPDPVRAAYLRHDGVEMTVDQGWRGGLFPGMEAWCSLQRMVGAWQTMNQVAENLRPNDHDQGLFPVRADWWQELAISPEWWNRHWIPIGLSTTASRFYIDLAPCPRGTVGQVIADSGAQDAILIAPGLNEWIAFATDSLDSGRFVTVAEGGCWIDTLWGAHNRKSYSYYGWRSSGAAGSGPLA